MGILVALFAPLAGFLSSLLSIIAESILEFTRLLSLALLNEVRNELRLAS